MAREMKTLIAGFGGQGSLFVGKLMAYAGLMEDRELSWMPSYGPEMRGGTANCSVNLSDEAIGSPIIINPHELIAMNQPSFDKFLPMVEDGGLVIADTNLVVSLQEREGVQVVAIPASAVAEENGLKGLGNVVLLGKLLALTEFCAVETMEAAIKKAVPARKVGMVEKNIKALHLGMEL